MPLHLARVARNVSDTLRERFGRIVMPDAKGSLVCERQQRASAPRSSFMILRDMYCMHISLWDMGILVTLSLSKKKAPNKGSQNIFSFNNVAVGCPYELTFKRIGKKSL